MTDDLYTEILLDEYKNLQHKGSFEKPDLVLEGSNASCGDNIKIYLKLEDKKIIDIAWEGAGCVISQVAMSLLTQAVKNSKSEINNIKAMNRQDMLELLGLEQISPGREKCLMLGLKTLQNNLN